MFPSPRGSCFSKQFASAAHLRIDRRTNRKSLCRKTSAQGVSWKLRDVQECLEAAPTRATSSSRQVSRDPNANLHTCIATGRFAAPGQLPPAGASSVLQEHMAGVWQGIANRRVYPGFHSFLSAVAFCLEESPV